MAGKPMFFTVRKHWKKSLFAACLSFYGSYYASKEYGEYVVRREICNEARKLGQEPIGALEKPRRMYVLLNPQANNGKAVKMYDKGVAPILHLAGIDVTLIKSDYEGHLKSVMGYIDPSIDGIIVAGGDGTLMEVVTGFIRLQDKDVVSRIPLGVIPLGKTNSFFKQTNKIAAQNARTLGNATMTIIKGKAMEADVIEVASEGVRPTYALSSIYWGLFQEVKSKIDAKKHWWAGPWKKEMAFVLRTVRNWPHLYTSCLTFDQKNADLRINSKDSEILARRGNIYENKEIEMVMKLDDLAENSEDNSLTVSNEQENNESSHSQPINISGLHVLLNGNRSQPKLLVQIWNNDLTRKELILTGAKWIKNDYGIIESEQSRVIETEQMELNPRMNELTWYHIDGEEFEAKDIKISIIRNKLKLFE